MRNLHQHLQPIHTAPKTGERVHFIALRGVTFYLSAFCWLEYSQRWQTDEGKPIPDDLRLLRWIKMPIPVSTMSQIAKQANTLLHHELTTCRWEEDEDGIWTGACSITWQFELGDTPVQNDMNYCPKCGKPLEAKPYQEPTDEDHE